MNERTLREVIRESGYHGGSPVVAWERDFIHWDAPAGYVDEVPSGVSVFVVVGSDADVLRIADAASAEVMPRKPSPPPPTDAEMCRKYGHTWERLLPRGLKPYCRRCGLEVHS